MSMAVPPPPSTLTSKPPSLEVTVCDCASALVTISIDPGATEAGTVYLKSLMVMTAAADAEGVAAAEVLDVAEEVWALDVVGAVLEDVPAEVEDVAAGAGGLLFDPLQAPSARVAPRAHVVPPKPWRHRL